MKIFGFPPLPHPHFKQITTLHEARFSNANEILYFSDLLPQALELGAFLQKNNVEYAVEISNIENFLFFCNLGARYALIHSDPLPYQNLAKEYVLDLLVFKVIEHKEEIGKLALAGIDGAIFKHLLLQK